MAHAKECLSARWPLPFWKMSGAGNDFVLIDHRGAFVAARDMAEFARLVCRPKFGVGADGLIFIERSEEADFQWRFFNADGSEAEMCGNGARCAARFAFMQGIAAAHMRFLTRAGLIEASVDETLVTVSLTPATDLVLNRRLQVADRPHVVHSVNTGVPHAVLFVEDLAGTDVRSLGRALRFHEAFGPKGTNVNFVALADDGLHIRSYERGVEDETFACGTGAVAAALIAVQLGLSSPPVRISTTGGAQLDILFTEKGGDRLPALRLRGSAHVIYRGELTPEALA